MLSVLIAKRPARLHCSTFGQTLYWASRKIKQFLTSESCLFPVNQQLFLLEANDLSASSRVWDSVDLLTSWFTLLKVGVGVLSFLQDHRTLPRTFADMNSDVKLTSAFIPAEFQWWNVTKYIYTSKMYKFEVRVLEYFLLMPLNTIIIHFFTFCCVAAFC